MKEITGLYLKHIKYAQNGCTFTFKEMNSPRSITLSGNVPKIENLSKVKKAKKNKNGSRSEQGISMTMKLTLDDKGNVTDYVLFQTERNISRLQTLGYEPAAFFSDVRFHQKAKCKWRDLKKSKSPYQYFSFEEADMYYKNTDGYYESDLRMSVINKQVLEYFRAENKCKYPLKDYLDIFRKMEKRGAFAPVSHRAIFSYFVAHNEYFFDGYYVYDNEIKKAMEYINHRFTRCGHSKTPFIPMSVIESVIEKEKDTLTDEQIECLRSLSTDGITMITGGAGTGKTTIIKWLLEIFEKHFGSQYLLMAPTGKASRRIAVKCDSPAYTMHHALRKSLDNDFIQYKESCPFPESMFIVDESSMIDTLLMRDILRAISVGSKVIFVGDYRQLKAVGVGSPFHEMIESGLCDVIELTKNFRQADDNAILENAEAVLNGEMFHEGKGVTIYHGISLSEIGKYIDEDTINISPYCKIIRAINRAAYNLHKEDIKFDNMYYRGCKVVFTKNTSKYNNGDTGIVACFNDNTIQVVLDDTHEVVFVERDDLENMKFAYGLTAHKVQGSEYDKIRIFLPEKLTSFSADPSMLYTMITRARKEVEIYYYTE